MQMIPHWSLIGAVNGVLGAICHSVHLTELSQSDMCLTVASPRVFHSEALMCGFVALIAVSGL